MKRHTPRFQEQTSIRAVGTADQVEVVLDDQYGAAVPVGSSRQGVSATKTRILAGYTSVPR
jgi:hypothetical protein